MHVVTSHLITELTRPLHRKLVEYAEEEPETPDPLIRELTPDMDRPQFEALK